MNTRHAIPGYARTQPGDFKPLARAAFTGRPRLPHVPRFGGVLNSDVSGAVRGQNRVDPPSGDHPLLSFLLRRGQLGLDTVGFLTQPSMRSLSA
ncbi:MAG: hypothetical protein LBV60_00025 [Streptomyces sp.]|nr:hypothetical protein [Streptomyces sp.]